MKVLCIPDIHQDIDWVKRILEKEQTWDRLIFLGDFFDSFKSFPDVWTARNTATFMLEMDAQYPDKITWIMGNHDIQYAYDLPFAKNYRHSRSNPHICGGFTRSKSCDIAKVLTVEFFGKFKLVDYVDGVLYSHAGILPNFIPHYPDGSLGIDSFLESCKFSLANFRSGIDDPLLAVGTYRGGDADYGGVLWCDWNVEFFTNEFMPKQICGHTYVPQPSKNGNAVCIDSAQTCYAIIEDGEISPKYLANNSDDANIPA